jgi:hypothetical protein
MSYFIIPKINNTININPIIHNTSSDIKIQFSHSLFNYYNVLHRKIISTCVNDNECYISNDASYNTYDKLIRSVNPYEYIFSKVPGSKFSVSKLKPQTSVFYDFLEVSISLNILDTYKSSSIKSLHITPNSSDTVDCYEMLRENYSDEITIYDEINDKNIISIGDQKYDFMFLDTKTKNINAYIISFIENLMIILRNQKVNGSCIIKISHIFYKPIADILFILSSLYERVYILKPQSSNVTTFEKYIVCKNFEINEDKNKILKLSYFSLAVFLKKYACQNIISILDTDVPYYFTMKLNDINMIIGQQQLESLNLILNLLKNKNKDERYDNMKKSNIQKAVTWCEKYKIPCNKFTEKTNMFLPINKEN